MRIAKTYTIAPLNNHLVDYPSPINLSYFWSFGSLAGICLVIQIISGILLAMHYTPHVDYAFFSIEHIMRDVNNGWIIRYIHANGASMFFILIYIHIYRGLYYGSYQYPRQRLWISGIILFILMMATAFMGYVLPWGQMSFWGATVIINFFSTIPFIGNEIVKLLWGGFSVDNPTLNRFFSLHYLIPFLLVFFVIIHLLLLHENGSNNSLGISSNTYKISFYPYFYVKDLYSLLNFFVFFALFVFFQPNILGHPDNYIQANSLSTPAHIVPEWYFLPFYAILRSIPNKDGGVFLMALSLIVLLFTPYLTLSYIRSSIFRPFYQKIVLLLLINTIILGWIGQKPVEYPFLQIGLFGTFYYFCFFIFFLPLIYYLENYIINNKII